MVNLLMCKDTVVLRFDFETGLYEVLNDKLLPHALSKTLRRVPKFSEIKSQYDDTQKNIAIRNNGLAIDSWASARVLPITRANAKKIYSALNIEQRQDAISKAQIAYSCRAVSLQDNYWIKLEGEQISCKDVNLREVSLSEAIAQISLHGSSFTIQGKPQTPELTGQGAYAKAWFREGGKLWLYKAGSDGPAESRIEVMVSNILDKTNVDHLHYELAKHDGTLCCRCECMTSDDVSLLAAMDYEVYCNRHVLDFMKECKRIDSEMLYKMWIVDYLIANRDRHGMNWGFFIDSNTNEIIGMHPLYDHNNAFDIAYMQDDDSSYQAVNGDMTMKQAAMYAMSRVDFHFTKPITREDFITDRQYNCFMRRAEQLGVQTGKNTDDKLWDAIPTLEKRPYYTRKQILDKWRDKL